MKSCIKLATILCTLLLCFFSVFSFGSEPSVSNINRSPESVVNHFYYEYLTAWNYPNVKQSLEKSNSAIDSFTTRHLQKLRNEDESGADYFTNVQDICPDWVSEITTNLSSLKNNKAVVELILGHSASESKYKINLVRNKDKWLLDSVSPVSRATGYCNDN